MPPKFDPTEVKKGIFITYPFFLFNIKYFSLWLRLYHAAY